MAEYPRQESNNPKNPLENKANLQSAAISGAVDPDVARIMSLWPVLTPDRKAKILAILDHFCCPR